MYPAGRPLFPPHVYQEWIQARKGTAEQQKRYQAAIDWYRSNPEQMSMNDQQPVTKKLSKLGMILLELVEEAQKCPGVVQRKQLAGGLRVDVMVKGDTTYLQLSRDGVYPGDTEWKTTLKNWPILGVFVEPVRTEHQGRYYLTGKWTITETKGK